jgi:hypothetical protein
MRAGAGSHHEEEGILHPTMQPNDASQPAEDFALAALTQDGGAIAIHLCIEAGRRVHAATIGGAGASRRANLSL